MYRKIGNKIKIGSKLLLCLISNDVIDDYEFDYCQNNCIVVTKYYIKKYFAAHDAAQERLSTQSSRARSDPVGSNPLSVTCRTAFRKIRHATQEISAGRNSPPAHSRGYCEKIKI